ncbi:MAG: hypothetical protein AABX71_03110 [Nanoarchaeota archaeon]
MSGMMCDVDSKISRALDDVIGNADEQFRRDMLVQAVMQREVDLDGNIIRIADISEGYYLVALQSHRLFSIDRVKDKEGVVEKIIAMNWQYQPAKIQSANFNYF